MERWQGRVAVVTGASAGIGSAIVYQLLDAGVDVVALARRSEKIQESVEKARKEANTRGRHNVKAPKPGKLRCVKCDVCREDDIISAFKWIKNNTKGVDILVNNAGVVRNPGLTVSEAKTEEWSDILNTNVLGLSICTREAIQQMKSNGIDDGHIVHIGSIASHIYPANSSLTMYCASKHAVRVLTEGLRKELVVAKSKIRVTEVSPGVVKTEMLSGTNLDPEEFWKQVYLQPEDIADAVLYVLGVPPHVQIHEIIVKPVGELL